MGKVLEDVCSKVRGGILMFFPSYKMMEKYRNYWCYNKIISNIKQKYGKKIFFENPMSDFFDKTMT